MRKNVLRVLIALCCLVAVRSNAQQTLGSVSGTVLDPTGAAIPNADVTVSDTEIGVTRTTQSHADGFFQVFNLPIGTYRVQASRDGFETAAFSGVGVQEAHTATVNLTLKVGPAASTSIDVTATPLLNATDATNGYTLDTAQISITPLATGSFTQLAVLSPGTSAELLANLDTNSGLGNQPIWANGQRDTSNTFQVNGVDATNLFNGKSSSGSNSQRYAFNIGQTSAVGGAAGVGTSVYGSNGNSLPSPPPEFLQELRVNTSLYDAQQGATSGAQIDANTLSGTNTLHGQVYGSFANNSLNADPFFFKQQYLLGVDDAVGAFPESLANPALHRWTTGASVGGPIIKDKLFFFLAYQHRYNSDQSTGISQLTVPSGLTDDRSAAGLDTAAAASNGGKAYTGAIDPIAMSLFNAKLPNGQFLIPSAQTTALYQYSVPNVTLFGTSVLTADQASAAIDYNVSEKDRLSVKYFYQNDPVTKPYGYSQTAGFPVTQMNGAQVFAIDNTISFGSRINWEQVLGFGRESSYSSYQQQLAGGNFGINGGAPAGQIAGALAANELPGINIAEFADSGKATPSLSVGPYSAFLDQGFYQNRINPSTNFIYTVGHHTIVAGGGYNYTQLNIENNRAGHAEIKAKSFESFLGGATSGASVLESSATQGSANLSNRYYRSNEIASYVQDKWQARPNLSITVGVRYDYHGALTEKNGNLFNFDPNLYSVTGTVAGGFQVANAGFVVAGNNKQDATAGTSNSTLSGRQWGISPKVGFAWSPKMFNDKVVINGGAGIYYDRGELFTYLSQPAGSGNGGPFGVTESAPLASYVTGNGKTLANPFGSALTLAPPAGTGTYIAPNAKPSTINAALQNVLGMGSGAPNGYSGQTTAAYGQNCGGRDNQEGYTDCPDALNFASYDKNNVLPYAINYALNIQWQPRSDIAVTIGYSGNRGRHAVVPVPLNEPGIATATNPIHGETATYGFEVLNQNNLVDGGYDYAPIAGEPWNSEDGGNADFRVPYIGFSPNAADFKTAGNSAYDALQTHIEKRLAHHLAGGASYTYSHALDEQSDIGLFFTGNNPNNLRQSYASADFDRTHVFTINFEAQLPDFSPINSLAGYATNGWSLTGIGVVQSGQPYSLYEFYGAVGSVYFGDFPTLANPVLPVIDPKNVKLTGNKGDFRGVGGSYIPTVDPSQIAINYLAPGTDGIPISTGTDPQDIYETDFAPSDQRNIFKQSLQKRLDISVRKNFRLGDKFNLQYNFDVYNLFNTTSLDVPQNQTQIRQNSACSATATTEGNNCSPGKYYYVNYGQIVTANNSTDQQSALANLDQKPVFNGNGKSTNIPTTLSVGQGPCTVGNGTITSTTCANNGANFGSVTGTIGGNRAIVMGLHMTF